jgi:hypothetical protein
MPRPRSSLRARVPTIGTRFGDWSGEGLEVGVFAPVGARLGDAGMLLKVF